MNAELEELKKRIRNLTDEQLLRMVTVERKEYREEALNFARSEIRSRGLEIVEDTVEQAQEAQEGAVPEPAPRRSDRDCIACGGRLRAGTLVAEKELTIIFSDNHEERFVRVTACVNCGEIALIADFKTDVER